MNTFVTRPRLILLLALLLPVFTATAQDIHFSQFANSPLNLNPGLAGVFGGDMRFVANYRNQWQTIPVPYNSFSGSFENKIYWTKGKYDRYLTGALLFNYDKQGSIDLSTTQIGIPISVTLPLKRNIYFTVGVTPLFGQRAFSTNHLTFDSQWTDSFYDPSADTREDQLFQNANLKYFDLHAGMNLRFQSEEKRTRLDVGGGLQHINRPTHDFWSSNLTDPGTVKLYNKMSLYSLGAVQLSKTFDVVGQALYQKQGGFQELVYGVGVKMYLNQRPYREFALQVGADYRHRYNDAIAPHVEVFWRTWTLGFTYDVNAFGSDIARLTNDKAGPEVALIYRLYKVKPVKFKTCPII